MVQARIDEPTWDVTEGQVSLHLLLCLLQPKAGSPRGPRWASRALSPTCLFVHMLMERSSFSQHGHVRAKILIGLTQDKLIRELKS